MIEIAAILSAIVKDWSDFGIIMTLLLINGVVGFWEEHNAQNVIKVLKEKMALKAKVLRNGTWKTILARDLVPGDIIEIKIGDVVPADIVVIEGDFISVDESALTGESLPVDKKKGDTLYSGSIVKMGEVIGVVKSTGENNILDSHNNAWTCSNRGVFISLYILRLFDIILPYEANEER